MFLKAAINTQSVTEYYFKNEIKTIAFYIHVQSIERPSKALISIEDDLLPWLYIWEVLAEHFVESCEYLSCQLSKVQLMIASVPVF